MIDDVVTDDAAEEDLFLWSKSFVFPLFCFSEHLTDPLNCRVQRISQQLIHKTMQMYAVKHGKSHSIVPYFSNPPRHPIDVSVQRSLPFFLPSA